MQASALELPSGDKPQPLPITVSVADIHMDAALQSREAMSAVRVKDYERAYSHQAPFPPLKVTGRPGIFPGQPAYLVLDGWHRLQALKNIGAKEVEVLVIETPVDASPHYLRWLGGRENLKNGEPLKSKDKLALFLSYVKAGQNRTAGGGYKSYRDIATELQLVTHQTTANWMRKHFPSIWRRMGKQLDEVDNKAQGTGQVLVDMPFLSNRGASLMLSDLIEEAKGADNDRRWAIRELLQNALDDLDSQAPCSAPEF